MLKEQCDPFSKVGLFLEGQHSFSGVGLFTAF